MTATNKDLRAAVAAKTFREDLYFRIAAVPITIPPLRDRGDDVHMLADTFGAFPSRIRTPGLPLTPKVRQALRSYPWPGNVRELQNRSNARQFSDGDSIDPRALQLPAAGRIRRAENTRRNAPRGVRVGRLPCRRVTVRAIEHIERFKIEAALRSSKWNKTRAAELLGVSYKTLLNKIRGLGLEE